MPVNDSYDGHEDLRDVVLHENTAKDLQIRFTVSEFRGNLYMGFRKWVIDMDESWIPTRQGFTWAYNLTTTSALLSSIMEIMSEGEVLHEILKHIESDPE